MVNIILQEDKKSITLSHCPPNPSLQFVESLKLPSWEVNHIISVGGGSTIDCGKYLANKFQIKHTAVPTTAGTGSEVTRYCVLMIDGKKTTLDLKVPDSYVLDPKLVISLPELLTLSTGLDALCQCFEAMWSTNATPESGSYSSVGINLIFKNLKLSMEQPKNELYRMNMLIAANMSGRAIEITRTNICHAISYPLTELYDIPHGIACAMSLQYFAVKLGYTDLDMFFMQFNLPKYKIDKNKIADIVIQNSKILSYPQAINRDDIIKSLV